MIPAVPKASKIVFTDYLKQNRDEVKKWLDGEPGAFDWTPAIECSLDLEGRSPNKTEIQLREAMLRDKIHAVVHCDLAVDNLVEEGYAGPYDVVNCTGVLDAICATLEEFADGVKKLSSLVKKDGYLIVNLDKNSDSYLVSNAEFVNPIVLTEEDLKNAYTAAGFVGITMKTYRTIDTYILVIGQKQ